jgi:hypothetical protein
VAWARLPSGNVSPTCRAIQNVRAKLYALSPYGLTFGLLGRLANATAAVPFGWAM